MIIQQIVLISPLYTRLKWVAEGSKQPTEFREGTSLSGVRTVVTGSEVDLQEV